MGQFIDAERTLRELVGFGGPADGTRHDYTVLDGHGLLLQTLAAQGNWTAAEATARDALVLALKLRGREHSQTAWALGHLIGILLTTGRVAEADHLITEYFTPELLAGKTGARFRRERANYYARQARWEDALVDARAAVGSQPRPLENYHILATLLVQTRGMAEYQTLTKQLLAQYGGIDTAITAARLAMDCLALAPAKEDLEGITRWVDLAVQGDRRGQLDQLCPMQQSAAGVSS